MQIVALGAFAFAGFGILGVAILILWVLGIIDVLKRPDFDRAKRSAWILIVVLLPIIGTILYFALRPTLPDEREGAIRAATSRRSY